jgi:uncharacterized protein (TIGR01777 family)
MATDAVRPGEGWRVAVAGARGFVGSALARTLGAQGHTVLTIGRSGGRERVDIEWDPQRGVLPAGALDGIDAVVNVTGENIGQRWSPDARRRILESRVRSTGLLATAIATLSPRPHVLLNMSATGVYGDRGDVICDESTPPGEGFLSRVVQEWEASATPARAAGIRVPLARCGVILHPSSGILQRLVPIYRLGGGGKIGDGRQWLSWIARTDVIRALTFLLFNDSLDGPVNVTSPHPVQNATFTTALAAVLRRPARLTVPAFAVRLLYGQMGAETVVGGQRAVPRRLTDVGFEFQLPEVEAALRHELADR